MRLVHLTASTFFGGPERQMLGLADALRGRVETTILSFAEGGRSRSFIDVARRRGFSADSLITIKSSQGLWNSAVPPDGISRD